MRFFRESINYWGSYGMKQVNPWQMFQIANQVILILFPFYGFSFILKSLSMVRSLFLWGKRCIGHWGRYDLKQRNPWQIFKLMINLYFSCFIFGGFPFYIKHSINDNIFFYMRENVCRPLRKLHPETGEYLKRNSRH